MLVNTDLHIHSCFSMATSKDMLIKNIAPKAREKGLSLVGSGDGFHTKWLDIIEKSTEYVGDGIYSTDNCDFILTVEVEGYKKIHHLLILPNIDVAREIGDKIVYGNKNGNGRPKTKLESSEILDIAHEYDCLIGPAHVFTPWTGMYKSYASIYDCYEGKVDFVELGLSADTFMADRIKELKDFPFLSNSDAHSPWPHRLGREFNQIELEDISYTSLKNSIKHKKIKGNYGLYPNLGKYHMTGCSKCYKIIDPETAKENNMKCKDCGGKIKKGVDYRINEISDFKSPKHPNFRPPYTHLMPLAEIISKIYSKGITTKTVQNKWKNLISNFESEIDVLINSPLEKIEKIDNEISRGIKAFRMGEVKITSGGGGKYGEISFDELIENKNNKNDKKLMTLDSFR
ncbi:TIGR00375 family protein [uncultured Methanobrevibacter sp.]|uniref:TIGR00375 family protein n=1 Tax=uncultured Methanobrevibacter sp. TaxID=253161 RepID=UPI0025DF70F3|nr:TIGR00375 family protein [uncultured Methanobrevibacter sp.]